jgi:hypothetical protein
MYTAIFYLQCGADHIWLNGVSEALAYGLRWLRDLRPLRHSGHTPALYAYRRLRAFASLSMARSDRYRGADFARNSGWLNFDHAAVIRQWALVDLAGGGLART